MYVTFRLDDTLPYIEDTPQRHAFKFGDRAIAHGIVDYIPTFTIYYMPLMY